jgi:hypothetical protein
LDAAEPPRIVFEDAAQCADGDRMGELLRQSVGASRATAPGRTVKLRVERTGPRAVRAEGTITDEHQTPIARRLLLGTGPDCSSLTRAVGVWASLVLDAETRRPRTAAAETQAPTPRIATPETADEPFGATRGDAAAAAAAAAEETAADRHEAPRRHEESFGLVEVGASGFVMSGTAGGATAGSSAFLFVDAGQGFFVRPALAFGRSIGPAEGVVDGSWLATRLDACARVQGLYTKRRGMQLDLCAGADLGATLAEGVGPLAFVAVGPSVDLRGELGNGLAVTLRGVFGIDLVRTSDLWSGRLELALSWGLR